MTKRRPGDGPPLLELDACALWEKQSHHIALHLGLSTVFCGYQGDAQTRAKTAPRGTGMFGPAKITSGVE